MQPLHLREKFSNCLIPVKSWRKLDKKLLRKSRQRTTGYLVWMDNLHTQRPNWNHIRRKYEICVFTFDMHILREKICSDLFFTEFSSMFLTLFHLMMTSDTSVFSLQCFTGLPRICFRHVDSLFKTW